MTEATFTRTFHREQKRLFVQELGEQVNSSCALAGGMLVPFPGQRHYVKGSTGSVNGVVENAKHWFENIRLASFSIVMKLPQTAQEGAFHERKFIQAVRHFKRHKYSDFQPHSV